jgi:hypothetical protein
MAGQGRKKTVFYGPHECARGCGARIVKASREDGGREYDYPVEGPYPNTKWQKHVCPKEVPAQSDPSV